MTILLYQSDRVLVGRDHSFYSSCNLVPFGDRQKFRIRTNGGLSLFVKSNDGRCCCCCCFCIELRPWMTVCLSSLYVVVLLLLLVFMPQNKLTVANLHKLKTCRNRFRMFLTRRFSTSDSPLNASLTNLAWSTMCTYISVSSHTNYTLINYNISLDDLRVCKTIAHSETSRTTAPPCTEWRRLSVPCACGYLPPTDQEPKLESDVGWWWLLLLLACSRTTSTRQLGWLVGGWLQVCQSKRHTTRDSKMINGDSF